MTIQINGVFSVAQTDQLIANQSGIEIGDLIKGQVLDKNTQGTLVRILNQTYQLEAQIKIIESVGESLQFQVEGMDQKQVALRYLEPESDDALQASLVLPKMQSTKVTKTFDEQIKSSIQIVDTDQEQTLLSKANALRNTIASVLDTVTEKDLSAVIQAGYDVDKISIDMFKGLIQQQKNELISEGKALDQAITTAVTEFETGFKAQYGNTHHLNAILGALEKANLPVNLRNINKIQQVLGHYEKIQKANSYQILNILRNPAPFTIEAALKSMALKEIPQPVVESVHVLEPQIVGWLNGQGLTPTDEMVLLAKQAVTSQVPLDVQAAIKLEFLGDGLHFLKTETSLPVEPLIQKAVDYLKQGQPLGQIPLPLVSGEEAILEATPPSAIEALLVEVKQLNHVAIMDVLYQNRPMTLEHLIQAPKEATPPLEPEIVKWQTINQVMDRENITFEVLNQRAEVLVSESKDLQFIKAKISLEEIRLKMTADAARHLYTQGIDVKTRPIEGLVEDLRALEQSHYELALKTHDVAVTLEHIDTMDKTMMATRHLMALNYGSKIQVLTQEKPYTLEGLTEDVSTIDRITQQVVAELSAKKYEAVGTQVRPDLGDRLEKAFQHIPEQLEAQGIAVTDVHIRLARALGKSQVPLTQENLDSLKAIDQTLQMLTERLNPNVVAHMIRSGVNPMTLHMDELLEFTKSYQDAFLKDDAEKLSEAILELKQSNQLTDYEKQGMMGVYRMLHTIAKSKGAAAAFLVKNGMDLRVKNLFEAAKFLDKNYLNTNRIDANIDDAFGYLEGLQGKSLSIENQIKEAMSHQVSIERFFQQFSHTGMMALKAEGLLETYEAALEAWTEALKMVQKEGPKEIKPLIKALDTLIQLDMEALKVLEKNGLADTVGQLMTYSKMRENPFLMRELLNQLVDQGQLSSREQLYLKETVAKILEGGEKPQEALEDLNRLLERIKSDYFPGADAESAVSHQTAKTAQNLVQHQGQLIRSEQYYQVPIWLKDHYIQLNLYYKEAGGQVESQREGLEIHFFFDTKNLGKVEGHLKLIEDQARLHLFSDSQADQGYIQQYQKGIEKIFEDSHYHLNSVSYEPVVAKSPIGEGIAPLLEEDGKERSQRFMARI